MRFWVFIREVASAIIEGALCNPAWHQFCDPTKKNKLALPAFSHCVKEALRGDANTLKKEQNQAGTMQNICTVTWQYLVLVPKLHHVECWVASGLGTFIWLPKPLRFYTSYWFRSICLLHSGQKQASAHLSSLWLAHNSPSRCQPGF